MKRLIPYLFIIFAGLGWASGQQQQRGLGRQIGQMADIAAANQSSVASMKLHHVYSFMSGEQLPFPPPPFAAYVNAGAGWVALTGTGSVGAIPNSPPPAAMYVLSGSNWIPWTGSSGGGSTTNPLTGAASGGAAPGSTFNGSAAVTFDYHTVGAAPASAGVTANQNIRAFTMHFNMSDGSVISGTIVGCKRIEYAGTISNWNVYGNISGSATIGVKSVAFVSYAGVAGYSGYTDVTGGGTPPSLTTAVINSSSTLASWVTAVTANSIFCVQLSSPSSVSTLDVVIQVNAS